MKEKIVLVGAGSAMFTRGLIADLINLGWDAELALVDIDPQALRIVEKLARKMVAAGRAPIRVSASTDLREVLPGATAVICTIGVGGRRAWEQDVFIPRRYGIFQPVGDTAMPGGSSRALRMIPAMVDIARDVLDLAPKALFFNYGNPMSATCRGVRKATGANVIGLCHGVHNVAGYLAECLDIPKADLQHTAIGINHLTWFIGLRSNGKDLMPRLREVAHRRQSLPVDPKRLGRHFAEAGNDNEGPVTPHEDLPFCWWLTRLFGAFPCARDRHVTEFFPQFFADGSYYGKTLGKDAYSFEKTIAFGDKIYQEMANIADSSDPLPADFTKSGVGEHEQALEIISSIRGNLNHVFSVNVPNQGQVANLPPDVVIECPGIADSAGIRALVQDPLPTALAGTLATRFLWAETIVEAALEGSREKFIQALVLDGAIRDVQKAAALADELLQAQSAFLPQFKTAVS
jgi:alpha-galactosidase